MNVEQQLRELLKDFEEQRDYSMEIGNVDKAKAWDSAIDRLKERMQNLDIF